MKSLAFLLSVAASLASASAIAIESEPVPADASISTRRSQSLSSLSPRGGNAPQKKPCTTKKDNWGNALEKDRKKITIRASKHDRDDISDDFLRAIKQANNGGLVHLEKGKLYVIGKKLDLTFLKDVYVKIDGELKVRYLVLPLLLLLLPYAIKRMGDAHTSQFTDDIKYWQANNFYYAFQKSISFWVWGGK